METLIPSTVRQAWWLIAGGIFAALVGVVRVIGFVEHGGVVNLVMATLFLVFGTLSVIAAAMRIRRGDDVGGKSPRAAGGPS